MNMTWEIGNNILGSVDGPTSIFLSWTSQMMTAVLAAVILIGVIVCFLGLKLYRILCALAGFAAGAAIGAAVLFGFETGLSGTVIPIVILICGAVFAVLGAWVQKFGVFVLVFFSTAGIVSSLLGMRTWITAGVCIAAALLMAVLSVIKTEAVVIVVTGISGGLSAGTTAANLAGLNEKIWWIGYAISAALVLIGIWVQFMMHSRKIGKKEKVYAKQVREEVSRESEVERARQMLEDDEEDEEDEESGAKENEDDITIISEDL